VKELSLVQSEVVLAVEFELHFLFESGFVKPATSSVFLLAIAVFITATQA